MPFLSTTQSISLAMIPFLFNFLVFITPLIFFPKTSELFEFNKIIAVYFITILIISSWITKVALQRKIRLRRTIMDVPILTFLIALTISTFFSIDTRTSLFGYYSRFAGGLVPTFTFAMLYFAYVSNMGAKETKKVITTIIIASIIAGVYAFLEHFGIGISCLIINGKIDTSCWIQDVQARVFGTFGQPNWLAAWIVGVSPLIWNSKLNFKLIISSMMFAALLFTGSKSGLLAFSVIFIVYWGINRTQVKLISKLLLITISIVVLSRISTPKNNLPPGNNDLITPSSEIRQIVWQGALDVWKNNFLVGTGPETFAMSYYQYRPTKHNLTSEWNFTYNKAHNEYLNYAANTGLIGLAAYLALLITCLFIFIKNKNYDLFAGFTGILITNFFGFSTVPIFLLLFMLPAFSITLKSKEQSTKHIKLDRLPVKQWSLIITVLCTMSYALFTVAKYWYADYLYAKNTTESLKQAVRYFPNESVFRVSLAEHYDGEEKTIEAFEEAQKAVNLSPRNVKLIKQVGIVYLSLAEKDPKYYDYAYKTFNYLASLAPTDAWVFYYLGRTSLLMGNTEDSLKYLNFALEIMPRNKNARKLRAYIYLELNSKKEAKDDLLYILENISPDDPEIKKLMSDL